MMAKSKIKILFVTHNSRMEGAGNALVNIINQFNPDDYEVFISLRDRDGKLIESIKSLKVSYEVIPAVFWHWPMIDKISDMVNFPYNLLRIIVREIRFYRALLAVAKRFKPDIIHTNVGVVNAGYYVAKTLNIPHVWHLREYQDLDFGRSLIPNKSSFIKLLHHPNNYPIAITQGVFEHFKLENSNAKVVYDGVFNLNKIPKIKTNKDKYFLFVGNLTENKGASEVVSAFLKIVELYPEYELWLAGKDRKNTYLIKNMVNLSGFKDNVRFLGFRTDVYELMSKAQALIVASKFEGFGFITAEAMFNGCLVIGKNTAGTKEQLDNGLEMHGVEIGIRYNKESELVEKIQNICQEGIAPHINKLELAQKTVVQLYSAEQNVEKITSVYRQAIYNNSL